MLGINLVTVIGAGGAGAATMSLSSALVLFCGDVLVEKSLRLDFLGAALSWDDYASALVHSL